MTHEDYEKAAQYWTKKEQTTMPEETLRKAVYAYIAENNT